MNYYTSLGFQRGRQAAARAESAVVGASCRPDLAETDTYPTLAAREDAHTQQLLLCLNRPCALQDGVGLTEPSRIAFRVTLEPVFAPP